VPSLDRMNAIGASFQGSDTSFRVWAPRCNTVEVVLEGRAVPLTHAGDGALAVTLPGVVVGTRYQYRLDAERHRPDPASRWQPEGVHGPSVVVDPTAFAWTDAGFRGHALADLVFYELHVGTFTGAGTFEAIMAHLDGLATLGVTAVELMPVAEFPGSRNWGYDGVHLFAPQSTYGGPQGLRRLVDACHARGLSLILDVVYNHLGPEGNYLAEFGPYFTDRYKTPWGTAVNFDGPDGSGVRRHFIENARCWVREFHVDGFRLDAIHSIFDASPVHILSEIAVAAKAEGARLGRPVHFFAESHDNDRRIVLPRSAGGLGLDGVWSDDFHHSLHVCLTGERTGYYVDFGETGQVARAIQEGFAYQGERSEYFAGPRGTSSTDLEGEHFVVCIQNHDQVGNRAQGDRLGTLVPFAAVKLAAGLMLAAPALPLLFMGEEYGETAPFQFFTSFLDQSLIEAVRRGRAAEFTRFAWQGTPPDPSAPATFVQSRLDHAQANEPGHRALRDYYQRWLELRRLHPALGARGKARTRAKLEPEGAILTMTRGGPSGETVHLVANLTGDPRPWPLPPAGRVLIDSEAPRFGGTGKPGAVPLLPWHLVLYEDGHSTKVL
jgi:maltooligosyltrehalose trehalohydrolase